MKNTKNTYLKNGESEKDRQIKKYRRRSRALSILVVVLIIFALAQIIPSMFKNDERSAIIKSYVNDTFNGTGTNQTNQTNTVCENPTLTSSIVKGFESFMDHLFSYPGGFWTKFFIFLGVIYIIQIILSLTFDVIELVLLVFVGAKRSIVWGYRKITGKKEAQDEKLKQVSEL